MGARKITLKLVRNFGLGFKVFSPKLKGLSFEINIACFTLTVWSKPDKWFGFNNFWY
jgi:hypothetical protein